MVPRHPSCARIRLTEINGSLRTPVYTLQFFLPKNYALFKELPPPSDPPCGCRGLAEKTSGSFGTPPPARSGVGGRDWNRTSDLVLIRDAL